MNNLGEVSICVIDETRNLKYNIHIDRKFSIILGDSGSGKTMFCNTISYINENKDDTNYKIITKPDPGINVRLLRNSDDYVQIIRNSKNTVFIIDDNVKIPNNIDFRDSILDSDNSAIIMRRKKLVPYQISIDALYELKYCKGVIENKNKYNMSDKQKLKLSVPAKENSVSITEDSDEGLTITREYISELVSTNGNRNIAKNINNNTRVIIIDREAGGNYIKRHNRKM